MFILVRNQVSHPYKVPKNNSVGEMYVVAKVYLCGRINVGNQAVELACCFLFISV
jgi:hypothetical protein